jgi:hypothetical protein
LYIVVEVEAACPPPPIETNAYANTIAATNNFIMNEFLWNICRELVIVELEVTT